MTKQVSRYRKGSYSFWHGVYGNTLLCPGCQTTRRNREKALGLLVHQNGSTHQDTIEPDATPECDSQESSNISPLAVATEPAAPASDGSSPLEHFPEIITKDTTETQEVTDEGLRPLHAPGFYTVDSRGIRRYRVSRPLSQGERPIYPPGPGFILTMG
jgi:hypothetical protein